MEMRNLREFIKGENVKHIEVEYEGVRYEIQAMDIDYSSTKKYGNTVVLMFDRLDEIDESGTTGADFV